MIVVTSDVDATDIWHDACSSPGLICVCCHELAPLVYAHGPRVARQKI